MSIQKSQGAWIHLPPQQVGEAPSHEDNHPASLEHMQRKLGMSKGHFSPAKVQMTPQLSKKPRVTYASYCNAS